MQRRVIAVSLVTALAWFVPPLAAEARAPAIAWHECADDIPKVPVDSGVQCGELTLPVDWAEPDGATFQLAVARRAARNSAERVGVLVFGPGGPGDSGVERVRRDDRFQEEMQDRFDIVSFDPRGVARSAAPKCAAAVRAPMLLADQQDFDTAVRGNRDYWAACRATSAVFDHADTLSAVHDLEALRRALGERRLTFHGSSYGTLLGEQYAETYPGRVRAIVLESVFDHSLDVGAFVRSQAAALQDSFDEFVTWCSGPAVCALDGADVRAVWADVLVRADRGEYAPNTAFEIAALPIALLNGPNWTKFGQDVKDLSDGRSVQVRIPPLAEAVFCADWPTPVRDYRAYAGLVRQAKAAGPDIRYGAGLLAVRICLGWPEPVRNPPHRLHAAVDHPILLLNALHDPRTGYRWATNVAAQLGRGGRLLTYEGWGHGSYERTPCTIAAVHRYLIDLELPPPGARCAPAT